MRIWFAAAVLAVVIGVVLGVLVGAPSRPPALRPAPAGVQTVHRGSLQNAVSIPALR